MFIVKGFGDKYYRVPLDILEKYALPEDKKLRIKEKIKKITLEEFEEQITDNYAFYINNYEGGGIICLLGADSVE